MKKFKLLILIFLIVLTTGCGDYRELTDLAIVSSVGLDKIDNKYELTVQILDSKNETLSDNGSTSPKIVVYKTTGKTIHEAFRNAIQESPKKLYISHIETAIISEFAAKENISDFFDFFLRDTESSKDFNVLIAKNNSIKEIMDVLTPLETIPSENIISSIENGSKSLGIIPDIPFDKFVANVLINGIDAVAPVISIKKQDSNNEQINPKERLTLTGEIAVFNNYKLVTYLDSRVSLGYNLIKEGVSSNIISFKCNKESYASIELVSNDTKFSFDVKKNTIKIDSSIKSALSELNCNYDIEKEKVIKELEKLAKEEVSNIFKNTINSAKKYNTSDFLGIGLDIYRNNNNFYKKNQKNIDNIIKNMKSDIKVDIKIIQKGSIKEGDEKY